MEKIMNIIINSYQKSIIEKVAVMHHCSPQLAAQGMWDEQVQDFAALLDRIENDLAEAKRQAFYVVK